MVQPTTVYLYSLPNAAGLKQPEPHIPVFPGSVLPQQVGWISSPRIFHILTWPGLKCTNPTHPDISASCFHRLGPHSLLGLVWSPGSEKKRYPILPLQSDRPVSTKNLPPSQLGHNQSFHRSLSIPNPMGLLSVRPQPLLLLDPSKPALQLFRIFRPFGSRSALLRWTPRTRGGPEPGCD